MIKLKDKKVLVYKGDYRPTEALKNGEKIQGYNISGTNELEAEFEKTYKDDLTIYGKSDYSVSKNLCPPPESKSFDDGLISISISKRLNGKFDLQITQIDEKNTIVLMSPIELQKITLPAGRYTASSNSSHIILYNDDEDFFDLPHTFTLDSEQTVYFGTYDIEVNEYGVYFQVEKGETAGEYYRYFDIKKEASLENVKTATASGGKVETFGQNLFYFPTANSVSTKFLNCVFDKTSQTITINGEVSTEDSESGSQVALSNKLQFDLKEGDPICISRHILSGSVQTIGTGKVLWGVFSNGISSGKYYSGRIFDENNEVLEKDKYLDTEFPVKAPSYSFLMQAISGKNGKIIFNNLVVKVQVVKGHKNRVAYSPYFEPTSLEISGLNGLNHSKQPNYKEQINGEEIAYLSDCLEGTTLTKKIGKRIFSGQESFSFYNEKDKTIGFVTDDAKCGNGTKAKALCNAFVTLDSADTDQEGVFITEEGRAIFRLNKERGINSSLKLKDLFVDYYNNCEPITVVYPLKEEEISVMESPLKAFPYFTRIKTTIDQGSLPFGLASCIKTQ